MSIIIVAGPEDEDYIRVNLDLIQKLNPGLSYKVVVIDNSFYITGKAIRINKADVKVVEGVPQRLQYPKSCRGSYQHAEALNRFFSSAVEINSRYLLILDPDFYILYPNWIEGVLKFMEKEDLAFFGAPWHPKWFTKYRYFPCVHCLFIDSSKVSIKELDFTPDLIRRAIKKENSLRQKEKKNSKVNLTENDCAEKMFYGLYWVRVLLSVINVSSEELAKFYVEQGYTIPRSLKMFIRLKRIANRTSGSLQNVFPRAKELFRKVARVMVHLTLNRRLIGSSNDTGYQVYRKFSKNARYQSLRPVVDLRKDFLGVYHISKGLWFVEYLFPDRWSYIPKRRGFMFTKPLDSPVIGLVKGASWEAFVWQNRLFGFHLRRYNKVNRDKNQELVLLRKVLSTVE